MTPAEQAAKDRDGPTCARCGVDLIDRQASKHHRKKRRLKDADRVENIVILCGSGTTLCHGWTHREDAQAHAKGWVCRSWEAPEMRPCLRTDGTWVEFDPDGTVRVIGWEGAPI